MSDIGLLRKALHNLQEATATYLESCFTPAAIDVDFGRRRRLDQKRERLLREVAALKLRCVHLARDKPCAQTVAAIVSATDNALDEAFGNPGTALRRQRGLVTNLAAQLATRDV